MDHATSTPYETSATCSSTRIPEPRGPRGGALTHLALQGRFLLWLLASIVLSVWVLLILAPGRLGVGPGVFLTTAVRERLQSVAESIAADVGPALGEQWRVELQRYDERHGVHFSIYDGDGFALAGQDKILPTDVMEEVRTTRALMQSEAPPGSAPLPGARQPGRPLELPAWPQPSRRLLMRSSFILEDPRSGYWIGIRVPITAADGGIIPATIVAHAQRLWGVLRFLSFAGWLGFTALLVLLTLLMWWPLLWGVSRALGEITRATRRIAQEEFTTRLMLRRGDELGALADSVNNVAARLQSFVNGQKQFLSDITHEVSSPIARLQMGLEVLHPHVSPAGERTFREVQEEVLILTELAAELLAFSRSGMDARTRVSSVSLRALVLSVLERENARSGVVISMPADLTLMINPSSLSRAIGNLVRNALRYAGTQNGPIEVVAETQGKVVRIRVMDRGPGVPLLSLINLGIPFYRPQLARQRSTGGLGLGLATVKNCVAACGGTIVFHNRDGGGFEAEILLPPSPQAA